MSPFEGKIALITGGASGIGLATGEVLARDGAAVMLADRNEEAALAAAGAIRAQGGVAKAVHVDVASSASVEQAVASVVREFGNLHLALNNAGVHGTRETIPGYNMDAWDKLLAINLTGVMLSMRHEIPAMLRAGGGAIVNVSSVLGLNSVPLTAAYSAAKHGVIGLTKTAALEYASSNIRVTALCPGYIDTPLLQNADDKIRAEVTARHPIGRLGRAEEVAEFAAFLLSERASFVTGSYHLVDGGYSAI